MDHVHKFMNHSYQMNQIHSWPNHYIGSEPIPMQMCTSHPQPPLDYQYWPSVNNCSYSYPLNCHGSCNRSFMPNPYSCGAPYASAPQAYLPESFSPFPPHYISYPHCNHHTPHEYEKNMAKDLEQRSGMWNGWHPCEPHSVNGHFPFPNGCKSCNPENKEREKPKDKNVDPKPYSGSVKLSGEDTGDRAPPKVKNIPVKDLGQHIKREERIDVPRKHNSEKFMKDDLNKKASCPPKSSKLPPICLRVEPRKSASRSSRSPSPPDDKRKVAEFSVQVDVLPPSAEVKLASQQDILKNTADDNIPEKFTESQLEVDEACSVMTAVGNSETTEVMEDKIKESIKRKFSEDEAALVIQSAYRGFDVRRWEPVKKLKEIATMHEELMRVKHMIREMELSSDFKGNEEQKNVISETIMNLLLKLDAIQGLHSSIKEMRKSMVKELVHLEEKLDLLTKGQTEVSPGSNENSPNAITDDVLCRTQPGLGQSIEVEPEFPELVGDLLVETGSLENAIMKGDSVEPTSHKLDLNQISVVDDYYVESNGKLVEENEKLRNMVENLIKSSREQQDMILSLSRKVHDLERNLCQRKKLKMQQCRGKRSSILKDLAYGLVV